MKKRIPVLVLCGLALFASLAQASEYTVKKGDSPWKIAFEQLNKGSRWNELRLQDGSKITNPRHLRIGSVLLIPEVASKATDSAPKSQVQAPKKVVSIESNGLKKAHAQVSAPKKVAHIKTKNVKKATYAQVSAPKAVRLTKKTSRISNPVAVTEGPSIYIDAKVGRDPWRGPTDLALKLIGIQLPKGAKIRFGDRGMENIPNGELIVMVSGRNKVGNYEVGLSAGFLRARKYALYVNGVEQAEPIYVNPACNNWLVWIKRKSLPPITEVLPPTNEIFPPRTTVTYSGEKCDPEVEVTTGAFTYMHVPKDGGEKSFGRGAYAEAMYWEKCKKDCSGEYYWGAGGLGNLYSYNAEHSPSSGNGWRAAGELGLKRIWEHDALNQSWQIKTRLGWEKSLWENSETGKSITQQGPVYGAYAEYVRELKRTKLWWITQGEVWDGFSQSIDGPAEWNLEPESRLRGEIVTGLDWRFAPSWTLRGQAGWGYQGNNKESYLPWNLQVMYDLPHKNGRIAFGPYGQHYFNLGDSVGLFVRYETGDLVRKFYGNQRASNFRYTEETGVAFGETENSLKQSFAAFE